MWIEKHETDRLRRRPAARPAWRRLVGLVLAGLLGTALLVVRGSAQTQDVQDLQIGFEPSMLQLEVGESARVAVIVRGVPRAGLAAFQLTLGFDPRPVDVLNPNEAFRGTIDPFAPLGTHPFCATVRGTTACEDPRWFLTSSGRVPLGVAEIDNTSGRVVIAYATNGSGQPPTGDGTIAVFEIKGTKAGTTILHLRDILLADAQEPPRGFPSVAGSLVVSIGAAPAKSSQTLDPSDSQGGAPSSLPSPWVMQCRL